MMEKEQEKLEQLFEVVDTIEQEDYLRKKILFAASRLLAEIDAGLRKGKAVREATVAAGLSDILTTLASWSKAALQTLVPRPNAEIYRWYAANLLRAVAEKPCSSPAPSNSFFTVWEEPLKAVIIQTLTGEVKDVWREFLRGFVWHQPRLLNVLHLALVSCRRNLAQEDFYE